MADNKNASVSPEESQKIREELYKQNLELARLYKQVERLNKQRESLMHLITHKVKGSFTHSKYIFAGLLDGTFGPISDTVKKRAEQGFDSNEVGIKTIDLILNVSNMEQGLIKYDMKKFNFKEIADKIFSEKKVPAEKKGLQIEKEIKEKNYDVLGDAFWLEEAANDLVDNAIKYTPVGKVTLGLEKTGGKILFFVKDTGVGLSVEDKKNLFTEGGRGKDSVRVNVDSTGYGLYSAKLIAEAHHGRVWAESDGPEKGSTFFMELSEGV